MPGFENFEPIFGEPKLEGANPGSRPLPRFLFHVYAPDSSHLTIHVTDFHSDAWEAVRSISQLEDMRDTIGVGGSWSDYVDYMVASIKSDDVKLILERNSESNGALCAKLVAQKAKGMPRISFSLRKVVDTAAAAEAMANLSLELFKAFKSMRHLLLHEQEHSSLLTKMLSAEKQKNDSAQTQLELHSKRKRLQKMNSLDKGDVSATITHNGQTTTTPDKQAAQHVGSTKVSNHVVPAYRRARIRGVLLQEAEDDKDN